MTSKNKIIYAAWPYQSSILGVHNLIPMMRADAYARFSRICKSKVTFITGFDELGSRTEKIAKNLKLRPIELLEKLYPANKDCLDKFSISYDVLGRTSDKYHYDFVMSVIEELIENKTIIQKEDTISYCTSSNNELVGSMIKGTCKNCGSVAIGDQCKSCNLLMTHNSLLHSKCTTCNNEVKFIKKNSWVLDLNNKSIKKNGHASQSS
ncbi:MAG: Methionine--tRNA ligase [uncultured Sulfurovum sp.]|uniref:Methionine--tRNA ligase n=1 Tax=uncultured Sulfurovum sp. TaxID=269237 RepID=A0A6S6TH55_9BACT|nr:MAG: Methionine--tRNA ligase [uncultured Sulfurovum sp.]